MTREYSPEVEKLIQQEREKSDTEKLKEGAEVKEGGRVEFTQEQIKEAHLERIKSLRESGKIYEAATAESAMLYEELDRENFQNDLESLLESVPENIQNEVESLVAMRNDGRITSAELLKSVKEIFKPSLLSMDKTKKQIFKKLDDPRYARLAELSDEEVGELRKLAEK